MAVRPKPIDRSALGIDHSLLDSHVEVTRWARWLKRVERIVGCPLERLDARDPVRRKVKPDTWDEQAEFLTTFKARRNSRRSFGYFEDARIRFHIELHRQRPSFWDRAVWVIEPDAFPAGELSAKLQELFDTGNRILRPFYAIADTEANFASKSKKSGYGVDMQTELIGVFWLTYFNGKYVNFFGRDKLRSIREAEVNSRGEARIQLGRSPFRYRAARRPQIETELGAKSFVDPTSRREKPRGRNVPDFAELRGGKHSG